MSRQRRREETAPGRTMLKPQVRCATRAPTAQLKQHSFAPDVWPRTDTDPRYRLACQDSRLALEPSKSPQGLPSRRVPLNYAHGQLAAHSLRLESDLPRDACR